MSQELVDSIVDAMPIVEDCAYITDNSIAFRGKNLDAWTKEIRMTLLHDKMSYAEIKEQRKAEKKGLMLKLIMKCPLGNIIML